MEIAAHLDMELPTINRYLRGGRRPDPKTVLRINRAIARLTRNPHVGPCLDCKAMLSGLLDPSQHVPGAMFNSESRGEFDDGEIVLRADFSMDRDGLIRAALALLGRYGPPYLSDGYRECVEAYMRVSGEATARRFAVELNQAFLSILVAELQPPLAPVGFSAVCEVLRRHGIAVEVEEFGSFVIAWEHVKWVVRRELASASPSAKFKERLASEKRIFDALHARFDLALRATPANPTIVPAKPRRKRGHS